MSDQATINGQATDASQGLTILQASRRLGIDVPTLCYVDGLPPEGGCRMCLVQTDDAGTLKAACHTALHPDMRVQTDTPRLRELRRDVLSLMLADHAAGDFERDGHGNAFEKMLAEHDLDEPTFGRLRQTAAGASPRDQRVDNSHPYMRFNKAVCIDCRQCLNVCEQVQGQFVYGMADRGAQTRLIFGPSQRFADSDCTACGQCVTHCPTGAITDVDRVLDGDDASLALAPQSPASCLTRTTDSVCGYCGVGCRVRIESEERDVHRIDGVPEAAVNHGHLCVKGRYAHGYNTHHDRLTEPLLRVDGELQVVSWERAMAWVADRLQTIKAQHGPDALGVLTSSRSTNEAAYLFQKLFRHILGTNNVDCCARVCHSSTALALQTVTGTGAASASYTDIDRARCIVVAGANPTEAHPVVGARIKQAVLAGAKLIVIDPRRIELAEYADFHLPLLPGTNVALFNAIGKVLLDEELLDRQYLQERVESFDAFKELTDRLDLKEVADVTGVSVEKIRAAARLLGEMGPTLFVHGLGLSELVQGTASVMTLCNLGMLTGSIGRPGAGMLPLRGQNNVQGNADMGGMPNQVTGYQSVTDPAVRQLVADVWGGAPEDALPAKPGKTVCEMVEAAGRGELRALWVQGEDIAQSDPHQNRAVAALKELDLLVVQDLFFCETAREAHLVLPAASVLEQEGTFTNGERRIQHVRPAVPPPAAARPDWRIAIDLANALGADWSYPSPGDVMDEIARIAPRLFGGVSYDRLTPDGLQWPCPSPDHPGTETVHADGFLRGKGQLVAIDYAPSPEHQAEGYPYLLITGRVLDHYNVGTMTRRTPSASLVHCDVLEVHPDDATSLGLAEHRTAHVQSQWGQADLPVHVTDRVNRGTMFCSFHFTESHTNRLVGPHLDPKSKCPQYKATAVRVSADVG